MQHTDDRPLPTYIATYNGGTKSLIAKNNDLAQSVSLDIKDGKLFKSATSGVEYLKVDLH